jgi:hypothetical protein
MLGFGAFDGVYWGVHVLPGLGSVGWYTFGVGVYVGVYVGGVYVGGLQQGVDCPNDMEIIELKITKVVSNGTQFLRMRPNWRAIKSPFPAGRVR